MRAYHSTLALSRSALANSPLVHPTLVKDEASPSAEERGQGLRLVLQWAVNQLAPGPTEYPLGEHRPFDDPTWRDPHWWRYNILRHRYLEPLHPDDFIGGGRYTESLIALTGISSSDAFFDERNRAVRDLADRLRQQLIDGQADRELQRLALQEALLPLGQTISGRQICWDLPRSSTTFFPAAFCWKWRHGNRLAAPRGAGRFDHAAISAHRR